VVKRKANALPPPAPPARLRLRRWLWQTALFAGVAAFVVGGFVWLGHYAREQIRDREPYQVAFADIECQPPPGVTRSDFLDEVLYQARCPERFSILEEGLADKLKQHFAMHPWVAAVDKVEVQPPRTVRVFVTYRQAVLAVVVPPELAGLLVLPVRGVDREGVLLPKKVPLTELPLLHNAPPPSGVTGQRWGNAGVLAATHVAVLLQPHQKQLQLTRLTLTPAGLVLWGQGLKVVWGQPDAAGEATVEMKLRRLLEVFDNDVRIAQRPRRLVIDLRPVQGALVDDCQSREEPESSWRRQE